MNPFSTIYNSECGSVWWVKDKWLVNSVYTELKCAYHICWHCWQHQWWLRSFHYLQHLPVRFHKCNYWHKLFLKNIMNKTLHALNKYVLLFSMSLEDISICVLSLNLPHNLKLLGATVGWISQVSHCTWNLLHYAWNGHMKVWQCQ